MKTAVATAVLCLAIAAPALAKQPAGEAVKVNQVAELVTAGVGGILQVRQPVFSGDTIRTSVSGEAQILFRDDTRLVVGPGASLTIDSYVSSGTTARRLAIKAFSGAYRFITGRSGRAAYDISTPTAILGIRGTAFDFNVGRQGRTLVMLHRGAVRVCSTSGGCRTIDDPCEIAQTRRGAPAALENDPAFLVRRGELSRSFPYVRTQRSLREDFRIPRAESCRAVIAPAGLGGGESGSDAEGGASGQR